jgi:putative chitinase
MKQRISPVPLVAAGVLLLVVVALAGIDERVARRDAARLEPASADVHITRERLRRFAPGGRSELIEALAANAAVLVARCGLTTPARRAYFLSQITHETAGLRHLEERLTYSPRRLVQVFRVPWVEARAVAGNPRATANLVYGARLGNRGRDTDDGWQYRGSGYIHLTGRRNFEVIGNLVGLPLAERPELARDPVVAIRVACAYWTAPKWIGRRGERRRVTINAMADSGNGRMVSKLVNGIGLQHRQRMAWLARARTAFGLGQIARGPDYVDPDEWEVIDDETTPPALPAVVSPDDRPAADYDATLAERAQLEALGK